MAAGVEEGGRLEGLLLAVMELATNLVRHTPGGRVTIAQVERNGGRGVQVRGDDEGPGIADLDEALRDGESTRGSLGGGMGTMRRGVDEFSIESSPAGTHVVLTTWAT
jgi:serine/threonine-protein kinase RsbT